MAVDQVLADGLGGILSGDEWTVEREELEAYGHDETEDLSFLPEVVVRPKDPGAVPAILELAHRLKVPVTPRGGGTGLSGGALPVRGGIVLSLDRCDRILEIDTGNMVAVVEPGVITQVLQEEVERVGLYYPPDPASRGSCTIGGNLAENAGGPHAVKYGVTSDYVMGLEVVLANGKVLHCGGARRKDVAGYDLAKLFVGSEGTLGIITRATLRLVPQPEERAVLLASFSSLRSGLDGVLAVFKGLTPSACELLERDAVEAAARHLGRPVPVPGAEALIVMEVDGFTRDDVERQMVTAGERLEAAGAVDVRVAMTRKEREELWALRAATGEAVKAISTYKEEDCSVPRSRIGELVMGVKEIARRAGIRTICYGHAGDGNIHVNILRMDADEATWRDRLPAVIEEIFSLTVKLGGSITGEHGIGWTQRRYLPLQLGPVEMETLKAIKDALDPDAILNPGKIFPG
ncbi:MAG: FAD-binding protein [Acidobacteria bacterium]|nr:FAD-binding protein [Acidobacteriota bacterium]